MGPDFFHKLKLTLKNEMTTVPLIWPIMTTVPLTVADPGIARRGGGVCQFEKK